MSVFLGLDTSNYTTSCALVSGETGAFRQEKRLLPVKAGERGLRQSDAVFHHTKQLPELMEKLFENRPGIAGIGYSFAPRLAEGSYMPCFLVGENTARCLSAATGAELFPTSHQVGHILAALLSAGRLELLRGKSPFIAFHVSGGTTDMLMCTPDEDSVLRIEEIGGSSDLKAGQCIDRVGVRLGIGFPCGPELERLAAENGESIRVRPSVKGRYCSLSGIENQCIKLIEQGADKSFTAAFCLESIYAAVEALGDAAWAEYGRLPMVFAGGVMSNKMMRSRLADKFGAAFAEPLLSADNAVGVAVYAALKKGELI